MINVAVINLKDILKYLVKAILVLTIIICFTRYFDIPDIQKKQTNLNENIEENTKKISEYAYTYCFDTVLPEVLENRGEDDAIIEQNIGEKILGMELNLINNIVPKEIEENTTEQANTEEQLQEEKVELAQENLKTEVVEEKNMKASYTNSYGNVQIRNKSDYELTEDMLVPDIEVNKNKILLLHTHTCESYTPTEENPYQASGNYRTTDLTKSVARVGTELEKQLKGYGYQVIHDMTYHDYPAYSGSYERSEKTIRNILEQNSDIQIVLDLHRDAVGSGTDYGPKVKIGEEYAAQLMFVIGTGAGGLEHPNWLQNLKFAIKVQQKAEELYPGLFRSILLNNYRYNQNLTTGSAIIEVGATANTLEECMTSMKYLAKILDAM